MSCRVITLDTYREAQRLANAYRRTQQAAPKPPPAWCPKCGAGNSFHQPPVYRWGQWEYRCAGCGYTPSPRTTPPPEDAA